MVLKKHFYLLVYILSTSIHESLETLWMIISWVWIIHEKGWMLIGNKFDSIVLSVTCHCLRNFLPTHTHPLISIHELLETLQLIISWVWIICKRLNVNWIKIDSIILSVTCDGLKKPSPIHTHLPHIHLWIFETLWVDYFLSLSHL